MDDFKYEPSLSAGPGEGEDAPTQVWKGRGARVVVVYIIFGCMRFFVLRDSCVVLVVHTAMLMLLYHTYIILCL